MLIAGCSLTSSSQNDSKSKNDSVHVKKSEKNQPVSDTGSKAQSGANDQISVDENLEVKKPEFSSFYNFIAMTDKDWEYNDPALTSCIVYPNYFSKRTTNKSLQRDMLSVKQAAIYTIKNGKEAKDITHLRSLIHDLNKKYKMKK
jgi:hypothetical protein